MKTFLQSRFRWSFFTLAILLTIAPRAFALDLTNGGAPHATIVVAQSALEPAKDDASANKVSVAARDLQEYIRKISGATLPLVGDGSTPDGALVLVGKSRLTEKMKLDIPSGLTPARLEEGLLIQTRGDTLVLAGNDAGPYHGTEYAVYEFLNRIGVRWFSPGEWGEYVPQFANVRVGDLSVREKPDFAQRNWWLHATPEMAQQEQRWKIRNKMNPEAVYAMPSDSSIRGYVADAKLAETRPELFAKNFDGSINLHYPNLSNPETVKIAAEKAKEFFRKNPDAGSLGIAPDDGMPRDFTPETVKRNQGFSDLVGREGVPQEVSTTEEWLEWINALTREVNKEFPDKIISTNGYANRNMPPFGVKIDPNVSVMFAAIWSDTIHAYDNPKSWQMMLQGELLQRWAEQNNKVWIYGYDYTMLVSGLTPLPLTRKLAHDFPLLKKWGVAGFYDETRNVRAERGIQTKYVKAHLEWNANENVNALLDDYFSKWYGAAAQPARAFYDALEEAAESTPVMGHEDRVLPWFYTPALMQKLSEAIGQAERVASTSREKQHVHVDRLIFQHLQEYVAMNKAELTGNFADAARHGKAMLAIRPQLEAINPFLMLGHELDAAGNTDYKTGVWYWRITDRVAYYEKLVAMQSGATGKLVAELPQKAAFSTDPKDEGRFSKWYEADAKTANWKTISTGKPFYLQGFMDETGYPYLGQMWYQFAVDVPTDAENQKVRLYVPVVETEAWVWVNGQYIGHRPYRETYERPNEMDVDVTSALKPGKRNLITFRVSTSSNRTAEAGGLIGRLFLYSPLDVKPPTATSAKN